MQRSKECLKGTIDRSANPAGLVERLNQSTATMDEHEQIASHGVAALTSSITVHQCGTMNSVNSMAL